MSTSAERELRTVLRKIVAHGCIGLASDESSMCWYCGADAEYVRKPRHGPDCLFVRAKELLAKHKPTGDAS